MIFKGFQKKKLRRESRKEYFRRLRHKWENGWWCPCCGRCQEEFGNCESCGWKTDAVQDKDIDAWGGANFLSIRDYRRVSALIPMERRSIENVQKAVAAIEGDFLELKDSDIGKEASYKKAVKKALDEMGYEKSMVPCPVCDEGEILCVDIDFCPVCNFGSEDLYEDIDEWGGGQFFSIRDSRKMWEASGRSRRCLQLSKWYYWDDFNKLKAKGLDEDAAYKEVAKLMIEKIKEYREGKS